MGYEKPYQLVQPPDLFTMNHHHPHAAALLMFQPGVGFCGRFCLIPGSNRDLHFFGVV